MIDEGCQERKRSGFVVWQDIVCAAQCARGLQLQPFLIYRFQIWNREPKDFTSSQEHHLNNPPAHLPNGCCGSWSVSSSAQLVFSSFERVTAGSAKPSQCRWRVTKHMLKKPLFFGSNTSGVCTSIFNLGSWNENQAGDTDHFLWSCFLHRGNALFLQVLLNLLFIHGVNWNAPPQFLEFCKSNTRDTRDSRDRSRGLNLCLWKRQKERGKVSCHRW